MPTLTAGNAQVSITPVGGTAATVADVARARATVNATLIDTTSIDSTFFEMESGNLEARATMELYYSSGSHASLAGAISGNATLDDVSIIWASGKKLSGKAKVESAEWDLAPNGVAMCTVTVRYCNGATTLTA